MSWIMVDIEADGPAPGLYSMISFGAVRVDSDLKTVFAGRLKPISKEWIPEALAVSGYTREETLRFPDPELVMLSFRAWLLQYSQGKPYFVSDNNGFDWQFINYYFWRFVGENPFGHSSMNLGSFYKGVVRNMYKNFKHLRETEHTHDPVDDAKGNAEALIKIIGQNKIKCKL